MRQVHSRRLTDFLEFVELDRSRRSVDREQILLTDHRERARIYRFDRFAGRPVGPFRPKRRLVLNRPSHRPRRRQRRGECEPYSASALDQDLAKPLPRVLLRLKRLNNVLLIHVPELHQQLTNSQPNRHSRFLLMIATRDLVQRHTDNPFDSFNT
jgi:hypothetical protein